MSHVVLLGSDQGLVQRVQSIPDHVVTAHDRDQVDELSHIDGLESVLTASDGALADVVFFGVEIPVAVSLTMAESIAFTYPTMEIVLVAEPDTHLVLRAMRSGVRDIVPAAVSEDELKVLLHRVSENVAVRIVAPQVEVASVPADPHRVIVISGPKGGVGRSTIATNVAVALSRNAPMDTVLIDLDLQFGDAGGLLNLTPVHTIADAFRSAASSDTLILKTFLTVHPSGFYVLCCADAPGVADSITAEQTKHLLQQLSAQFRYVVVDTAAGIDVHTLGAIEEATDLVLVSSMDVSSTRALRREIDLLNELDIVPSSRHVVVNFADRSAGLGVREVEAAIGLPIGVIVPRSRDVQLANDLGEALMNRKHGGPVVQAFDSLIKLIRADEELARGSSKHRGVLVH